MGELGEDRTGAQASRPQRDTVHDRSPDSAWGTQEREEQADFPLHFLVLKREVSDGPLAQPEVGGEPPDSAFELEKGNEASQSLIGTEGRCSRSPGHTPSVSAVPGPLHCTWLRFSMVCPKGHVTE